MSVAIDSLKEGDVFEPTPWQAITQEQINAFADATDDHQWIHVDQQRCKTDSPFGTTIAHGLLTLSLMPSIFYIQVSIDAQTQTLINYGLDSLRFIESVREGDEIRYHMAVSAISDKATGRLYKFRCEVHIKGRDKPAMAGTMLMMLVSK